MHHISKSAYATYSCKQMFDLVNKIDDYPKFLNWCDDASILKQSQNQIIAKIKINKGAFQQSFTTINTLTNDSKIDMRLEDGPFKKLTGVWIFTALSDEACKIELNLDFEFASRLVDFAISPIFTTIANTQIDAFLLRAKQIYG